MCLPRYNRQEVSQTGEKIPAYPGDGYNNIHSLCVSHLLMELLYLLNILFFSMILCKKTINQVVPYCRYILICCSLQPSQSRENKSFRNKSHRHSSLLNWQDRSRSSSDSISSISSIPGFITHVWTSELTPLSSQTASSSG